MRAVHGTTAGDIESPLLLSVETTQIRCDGVDGLLTIDASNCDLRWMPCASPSSRFPLGSARRDHEILGHQIVGAALDSPASFQVWYCKEAGSRGNAPPRFKLQKSQPYMARSGAEATELVAKIRQLACWHGRDQAPRLFIIVNPSSGQGKSERLFSRHVLPILEDAAGHSVAVMHTSCPGHAIELTQQLPLADHDLLVVVGGDGTMWEAMQGLLTRSDWLAAAQLPMAHVPGGTGNGLAHSCGLGDPITAAFSIVKGITSPLDVASVLQPPGKRMYIMLSLTYGSLSNLDVETEHLRWMGDGRFAYGGLKEILRCRSYHAGVAWYPGPVPGSSSSSSTPCPFPTSQASSCSEALALAPQGPPAENGAPTAAAGATSSSSSRGDPAGLGGQPVDCVGMAFRLQDFPPGPELPLLSQFNRLPGHVPFDEAQLPPGWRVWHQPLQSFALINPPYVAANCPMNPLGQLHTGHMDLMGTNRVSGLWGRFQNLRLQLAVERGAHITFPNFMHDTARAVIFEPRDVHTYVELDGEVVESAPLYIEVHQGLVSVIINPAHPDEPAAAASRAASRNSRRGGEILKGAWNWVAKWCM